MTAYVPPVDASGDGVGKKAADANRRTASMVKTMPGTGAPPSDVPAVPAVPGEPPAAAPGTTPAAPAPAPGTTPAAQPAETTPATPSGTPRFVSTATLTPSDEPAMPPELEAEDDPGAAWLSQNEGDQARANREALETSKRASESAAREKATAEENAKLKAKLEGRQADHPADDEVPLPSTDDEFAQLVERQVAGDTECQRLAGILGDKTAELGKLVEVDQRGNPKLTSGGVPQAGVIRDQMDEIKVLRGHLKDEGFDDLQKDNFKSRISDLKESVTESRERLDNLWREAQTVIKAYGDRREAFENHFRQTVEATESERQEAHGMAATDAQTDSVFGELLPQVSEDQRDDIHKRILIAATTESERLRESGGIEDLPGFLRAEFEALKPLWMHAVPAARVEEARQRAAVAAQPAPPGQAAIAQPAEQPLGDARSRRKAAGRRTALLSRSVQLVHR